MPKELESVAKVIAENLRYWRGYGTNDTEAKEAKAAIHAIKALVVDIVDIIQDYDPPFDYDSFIETTTLYNFPGSQF